VRIELAKVEDEMAQNEQILTQRRQQLEDSVFTALLPGIVKNIRVTTVGGVLTLETMTPSSVPESQDMPTFFHVLLGRSRRRRIA